MATCVIYSSNSGFTKQYARWISKELNCDLLEAKRTNYFTAQMYDIIIYGGAVNNSKIKGVSLITDNLDILRNKKIIVFSCGLMDNAEEIKEVNLKKDKNNMVSYYHFLGGLDVDKLNMMTQFKLMRQKNKIKDENGNEMDLKNKYNFMNKEFIKPIVDEANEYEQKLINGEIEQ